MSKVTTEMKEIRDRGGALRATVNIDKKCLLRGVMELTFLPSLYQWRYFEKTDKKPAHWHAKFHGVDIHLRDGVVLNDLYNMASEIQLDHLEFLVEIKTRDVSATHGPDEHKYVYLNVFPLPKGEKAKRAVLITDMRPVLDGKVIKFVNHRGFGSIRGRIFRTFGRENGVVTVVDCD